MEFVLLGKISRPILSQQLLTRFSHMLGVELGVQYRSWEEVFFSVRKNCPTKSVFVLSQSGNL